MENFNELAQYSPILIFVLVFLFKHKIFVTPLQLEKKLKQFDDEIENKYVTRRECGEYKRSTEKGLEELLQAVNDIRNYLPGFGSNRNR